MIRRTLRALAGLFLLPPGSLYAGNNGKAPNKISVSVSPTSASLAPAGQQQFVATVSGTNNQSVSWMVASGTGSISGSGLFTAPQVSCSGEIDTVRATSLANTSKFAQATVTITASTQLGHSVQLAWDDPDAGITFNVYRSLSASGPFSQVAAGVLGTSYLDLAVTSGVVYYYQVTAVDSSNQESGPSNQVAAVIPCP